MPGDRLLVRQGDVVPVDGTVAEGVAVLDQSALTGEALPVQLSAGEAALSGSTNVGEAFDLTATRRAAESTYAGIVRLVEAAQRSRAPMSRLADRYAILFLAVTVALAGAAWALTGDPIRAVAVLVVATPCPLILAVPVAIVAGLSRAAKLGILIKGGKAIETLARVRALVIDKTGTLTVGQAKIVSTKAGRQQSRPTSCCGSPPRSTRPPSMSSRRPSSPRRARKGLTLAIPAEVVETPGEGITGRVEGRAGHGRRPAFHRQQDSRRAASPRCAATGRPARSRSRSRSTASSPACLILSDELRAGTEALLHELRALGIERIVLATGDRHEVADA